MHQPDQGAQVGRYRADNIQYRTNLPQQSVGSHSHEVQATEQQQHQQLHQPSSQYAHTYAQQGIQAADPHLPPQTQPVNQLDMIDPFQNYPVNQAPAVAVPQPDGYGATPLPPPQSGHGGDQATVHDRVGNLGQ